MSYSYDDHVRHTTAQKCPKRETGKKRTPKLYEPSDRPFQQRKNKEEYLTEVHNNYRSEI